MVARFRTLKDMIAGELAVKDRIMLWKGKDGDANGRRYNLMQDEIVESRFDPCE